MSLDPSSVSGIADLVKVVQNGSFVGVVARSEWGAIQAAAQLNVTWNTPDLLPDVNQVSEFLRQQPTTDRQALVQQRRRPEVYPS